MARSWTAPELERQAGQPVVACASQRQDQRRAAERQQRERLAPVGSGVARMYKDQEQLTVTD